MKRAKVLFLLIFVALFSGPHAWNPASAQEKDSKRPIDMEILIDNSCSMFPLKKILPGCDAYGADPDFLRITGANLFIARLGFAEPDEAEYQLGVIGVGDKPQLISPLQPLSKNRNELAAKISNPLPQTATKLIPALELAYTELGKSSSKARNQPAVVLITDGIPWPRETQGNADIEKLLSQHSGVPVFVMLLANPDKKSADYESYIQFWESLQTRYTNIYVYRITGPEKIQDTYNLILSQLQNSVSTQGVPVDKGYEIKFYIGHYTQRVTVTTIRKPGTAAGVVSIRDSSGDPVTADQAGIRYFSGKENPVEVFSIESPRLSDDLKGKDWTVIASEPVTVFFDRLGSYRINFLNPPVEAIDIANQYLSLDRQSPNRTFPLQFSLIDEVGKPVLDPQVITGAIQPPEGAPVTLSTQGIKPDSQGIYELPVNMSLLFPGASAVDGRYTLQLSAGLIDESTSGSAAIASARLSLDMGYIPVIRSIAPVTLYCYPGQPAELRVTVDDLPAGTGDKVSIEARKDGLTVPFQPRGEGLYRGDISQICSALVASVGCSQSQSLGFSVHLNVTLVDGTVLPSTERPVEARVTGLTCTPTPFPTATLLPTPTPTPVPDRDQDGLNDVADRCPVQWGFEGTQGCFPWGAVWGGSGFLLMFGILGVVVWPWVQVSRLSPPPPAYILACRDGVDLSDPIAIHTVSRSKRTVHVSIGSGRWAKINIPGLKPVEFVVEWRGGLVFMRDPREKEPFAFFDESVRIVRTSDPKMILRISKDPEALKCG